MSGALLMAASMPRAAAGGSNVSLTGQTVYRTGNGTASIDASYTLGSDGKVRDHTNAILESWLLSGTNSDYEARATLQSGTALTGTMNTWLGLGSNQTWSLTAAIGATHTSTFLVEIRDVATSTVRTSASITMIVENYP